MVFQSFLVLAQLVRDLNNPLVVGKGALVLVSFTEKGVSNPQSKEHGFPFNYVGGEKITVVVLTRWRSWKFRCG